MLPMNAIATTALEIVTRDGWIAADDRDEIVGRAGELAQEEGCRRIRPEHILRAVNEEIARAANRGND